MKAFAHSVGVVLGGLCIHMAAPAQPPAALPSEESVRRQIDHGDWYESARQIDRLVEAHLVAGSRLRPDPVLDRLIGEQFTTYSPGVARILLERAVVDPTTRDRSRYTLLLASANETLGDSRTAEDIYRRLLADPSQSDGHRAAAVGLARLLLIGRPREALDVAIDLLSRESSAAGRWEAELIAARAARMLGMAAEAGRYLDQASEHAWSAPVADAAVARIALDRAAVAGMAGDRARLIALSAVARGANQTAAGHQFIALLPECGVRGVTSDDFVIVELVGRGSGRPRIGLIYASRPQITDPFLEMATRTPLTNPSGQAMSLMLRCAAAPRPGVVRYWENPIIEWGARHGAYPMLQSVDDEAPANGLAKLVDREARLGADSPFLIPVLAQLLSSEGEALHDVSPGNLDRLLVYARRLSSLLDAQRAPADVRLPAALTTTVLTAMAVQQSQQATSSAIRRTLEALAADSAVTTETLLIMADFVPDDAVVAPGLKIALLAQALEQMRAAGAAPDIRMRGLAVRLIGLQRRAGNETGATALQREFGIAGDLCALAGEQPRYLSSEIRPEDYPVDAIWGNLAGLLGADLTVDARGGPRDIRLVVATPPFVFDEPMIARAPTIRYEPARMDGGELVCRGLTQSVMWRLP